MNRRTAIRNVVLISAGAAFLQSCQDKATIALKHIPVTGSEQDLLNELTEAIIPTTDFPGAKDLNTGDYVFMMADDCISPEEQQKFITGMKDFEQASKSKMGSGFVKLSKEKKSEFLTMIEADKEGKEFGENAQGFYGGVKNATIEFFTTSEQYMKEVRKVTSLIPSKFQGCVPVTNA
ncbi:MAG TPA: gluconate 2-dehydrogenase subunit 3 family protein [Cyclobacteriaceae bacterium]|nr:gluconate 2-dehydrogenase subunit 3 family protein [Cyclobacteriaceae bacterium]